MTTLLIAVLALALGAVIGIIAGLALARRRQAGRGATDPDLLRVELTLDRLERSLDESEALRRSDQAALRAEIGEQLRSVGASADSLRRETGQLASALGRVDVRGRWGEAQLRRLVEAAGMLERTHFVEQDVRVTDDRAYRPDMIVDLGAQRTLIIDAKVPLAALLEAEACDDPLLRDALFAQHARDVAAHAERLGSKDYWRSYDDSVESVVMFMPAESMLGIALREDPALLERAFARNVVIATPTTLLALLRTVAHVWRREAVTANAQEIHRLGRELHERLGLLIEHLRRVGTSLDGAVSHYNKMVGSLEGRVLVSARRLAETGVAHVDLPDLAPIERRTRALPEDQALLP